MKIETKKSLAAFFKVAALIIIDSAVVFMSGFMALLTRYEFNYRELSVSGFLKNFISLLPFAMVISCLVFFLFRLYSSVWQYAGFLELVRIFAASSVSVAAEYLLSFLLGRHVPRSYPLIKLLLLFFLLGAVRFSVRFLNFLFNIPTQRAGRIMLIGAGQCGNIVLRDISTDSAYGGRVVCIIDDDPQKIGRYVRGVRVAGGCSSIVENAKRYRVSEIILAIPTLTIERKREILSLCQKTSCKIKTMPSIYRLTSENVGIHQMRSIDIEDLLGRDSIKINLDEISGYITEKTVLVTGGGGSIGSELCRQLASFSPRELVIFDIYENNAYEIEQELKRCYPELRLSVLIGSVRDEERVNEVFAKCRPEIVYHAAAHKHVPLMENSPAEAIKNNVLGTNNVARAADRFGALRFVLISTDKAVNPTSVMGASKRICEMIVQSLDGKSKTDFVAVRFGNVLGSNGSVIPLFKKQIEHGGPVTVTHKDIIRYFMTVPEAVSLVLQAGAYAKGGEVFVLDMGEPVRIDDLARKLIKLSGYEPDVDIEIKYTGLRPGEKLFEELLISSKDIEKTANDLIFIDHPETVTADELELCLEKMKDCSKNDESVRQLIAETVPTFREADGEKTNETV